MSQITIRDLPVSMEDEIRRLAAKKRISISKAAVELLHKALGTSPDQEKQRDVSCVFGTWGEAEHIEFVENIRQFSDIDEEMWQ